MNFIKSSKAEEIEFDKSNAFLIDGISSSGLWFNFVSWLKPNYDLKDWDYSYKNFCRIPDEIHDTHNDNDNSSYFISMDTYYCLTGTNVSVLLVDRLQHICIFKESWPNYINEIDNLTKQVARYIRVFGPQTAIILEKLLDAAKKINNKKNIWNFGNSTLYEKNGKEFLKFLTISMEQVPIEQMICHIYENCIQKIERNCQKIADETTFLEYLNETQDTCKKELMSLNESIEWDDKRNLENIKNDTLKDLEYKNKNTSNQWFCVIQKNL